MRKPRDYDSELQSLSEKAKQLGELVIATGADALPVEQLAGALLSAIDSKDAAAKEGWRKRGAAFFQAAPRSARSADKDGGRAAQSPSGEAPLASEDRT